MTQRLTRREFLKFSALVGAGSGLAWLLRPWLTHAPSGSRPLEEIMPINGSVDNLVMLNDKKASLTYSMLSEKFDNPSTGLPLENKEPKIGDPRVAYLWPYSGVITAVEALARMPGGDVYRPALSERIEALDAYYDPHSDPPAYEASPPRFGGDHKYFDDNEWIGQALVGAYQILEDPALLDRAGQVFNFVASGWSDDLGGGIFWRQNDHSSKNTCSNAPGAVLAVQLYRETGKADYLQWAQRILDWTLRLKSPDSGVYWDKIFSNGAVDRQTYTYNTGAPMQANALMYAATKDEHYLDEARSLAAASLNHFFRDVPGVPVPLLPATPWFNAVLLRGYAALYDVDPERDFTYLNAFRGNLDFAWRNARDNAGMFGSDWNQAPSTSPISLLNPPRWVLDQAAMVEMYATLAQYDSEV